MPDSYPYPAVGVFFWGVRGGGMISLNSYDVLLVDCGVKLHFRFVGDLDGFSIG